MDIPLLGGWHVTLFHPWLWLALAVGLLLLRVRVVKLVLGSVSH